MLLLAGCTSLSSSGPDSGFEKTITPIVITAAKSGAKLAPGPYKAVAVVGVTALAHVAQGWADNKNGTYLLIAQTVEGKYQATVFRVSSKRKLRIDMNGRFVQEVERNLITITVPPEVDSTIVVTDAASGDKLFREGKFRLIGFDASAAIDLDSGELKNPKEDPEFAKVADISTAKFGKEFNGQFVNGSQVAYWDGDQPKLGECMSMPTDKWKTTFVAMTISLRPWFCVRTSEGRYGHLRSNWDLVSISFVLWDTAEQ